MIIFNNSQVLPNLSQVYHSAAVSLVGLPNLSGNLLLVIWLYLYFLVPLNESGWSPNGRFAVDYADILRVVNIMAHLIDVEYALRYLIGLLQVDPVLLHVDIVSDDRHGLKHLESVDIRGVAVDHPGRGQLRRLPDVHLLVLLEGMLSVKSVGLNSQPPGGLADNRHWWRLHRTALRVEMHCLCCLLLRRLPLHPEIVRSRILVELIPVYLQGGVRDGPCD